MSAHILDGKQIAADMRIEIAAEVADLKSKGITPGLAVVLIGENPASVSYVTAKEKACHEAGMVSQDIRLPGDTSEQDLLILVDDLNKNQAVHGILVQLPLPKHIDEQKVIEAIAPEKDVDGFHPVSVGRMMLGQDTFLPCTPHGIIKILERSGIATSGQHVVVVGRSNIVGKPVANMLVQKKLNSTVTICHTGTKDIASITRQADILIAAAGRPDTITPEMVKDGAVIIDVGVNRIEDATKKSGFRLVGDVDFQGLLPKVSAITPVPGGVGPMTITMLLFNTLESAKRKLKA